MLRTTLLVTAAIFLVCCGAAHASPIEGVWSFNGGQVAVQGENGTFTGTVVVQTKFAECTHPVGELMWSGIEAQPDGSFQGFHQWYQGGSACVVDPTLGPTAWRVLEAGDGAHDLRVCFSRPGTSQPTIAADGSNTGVTWGCYDSALTAPLPGATTTILSTASTSGLTVIPETIKLPAVCASLRKFKIHIREPKYDPFKTITVTLKGRKIPTTRKGEYEVATINLKGLPKSAFTIHINATTVLGHHLSASRTYHTCIPKIEG